MGWDDCGLMGHISVHVASPCGYLELPCSVVVLRYSDFLCPVWIPPEKAFQESQAKALCKLSYDLVASLTYVYYWSQHAQVSPDSEKWGIDSVAR